VAALTGRLELTVQGQTRTIVLSAVLKALIPAPEQAGPEEVAKASYVGMFVDETANATLILSTDSGPAS
jgi:hypothetical protein